MAGLFDKQAEEYAKARPKYPTEWYSMLAALTCHHQMAWDVGTGNGQAAVGVADHYEQVIATDVSEEQLKHATPHPKVCYVHTPLSMSNHQLVVSVLGGQDSIDLITVAQALHWFDLPKFYSLVTRVLRKPGGVLAVWGYNDFVFPDSTAIGSALKRFEETTLPYWSSNMCHIHDGYKNLSFPFDSVGLGSEGNPLMLDMPTQLSFQGLLGMLRSWSAVNTAKENGVDLLSEAVVKELETAWGGSNTSQTVIYKAFMLTGTPRVINHTNFLSP